MAVVPDGALDRLEWGVIMHCVASRLRSWGVAAALAAGSVLAGPAFAQESSSAPLAKQLVELMEARKLDSAAARHPAADDKFVAALYFPGQLLVVSARYQSPTLLYEKLVRGEYRDIYIDLNSASIPDTTVLVTDLGADGLQARRRGDGQAFDVVDVGGERLRFDGDWRGQRISEQDYRAAFSEADEAYAEALRALVDRLKQTF